MKTSPQTQPAQHTPGPWKITVAEGEPNKPLYVSTKAQAVCQLRGCAIGNEWDAATQANARLLAAAPELLAALESSLRICEHNAQSETLAACELMRAAIAKAKGVQS